MEEVRVDNVYKVFGRREAEVVRRIKDGESQEDVKRLGTAAVIDASFTVNKGEIFVVMGLSGSGKSTLIRTLNGLLTPSAGTVEIDGTDINQVSARQLRRIREQKMSMVFQHFALLPHRSVLENAAFGLEIQGVDKDKRLAKAQEWVDRVGLKGWGDKLPGQLSGGMQQRVGLARALASETDILLMDEAFSALDPLIRREMQDQLIDLQQNLNKTIIFITHDLNEAMHLGDRIAVMRDGRVVQIGSAEEILTDPASDYVAQFIQDVDKTRVLTAESIMESTDYVVPLSVGSAGALKEMKRLQSNTLLVTDNRRLLGYVRDRAVVNAVRESRTNLQELVRTDELIQVTADTPLAQLFAPSSASSLPLAVVDDEGLLIGIIPRVTLLTAMGNIGPDTSELPVVDDQGQPHTEGSVEPQVGQAVNDAVAANAEPGQAGVSSGGSDGKHTAQAGSASVSDSDQAEGNARKSTSSNDNPTGGETA